MRFEILNLVLMSPSKPCSSLFLYSVHRRGSTVTWRGHPLGTPCPQVPCTNTNTITHLILSSVGEDFTCHDTFCPALYSSPEHNTHPLCTVQCTAYTALYSIQSLHLCQ